MFLPLLILGVLILIIGIVAIIAEKPQIVIPIAIAGIIVIVISFAIVVINPGEVGVTNIWGSVGADPVPPGIHVITPFVTDIIIFDTRTQVDTQQADVLTSDAMKISTDISINYHLNPEKVPFIYKEIGSDFTSVKTKVVDPPFRSVVRDAFAVYNTESLYSSGRSNISNELRKRLENDLSPRGIILEDVLVRAANPPDTFMQSVIQKQTMEQEIQKKRFEVEKEKQEALRKIAEANGIAEANKIISNSITPEYIEWYTVDMLKNHHSDAMMYIPVGNNGLPMVANIPFKTEVTSTAKN